MSEVIVRMEMPRNCYLCPMANFFVDKQPYCRLTMRWDECTQNGFKRPSWCPIVGVLPEEHGRLIDEAVFCENVVKYSHQSLKTIGKALDATPTIIEMTPIVTERKDDEQIH